MILKIWKPYFHHLSVLFAGILPLKGVPGVGTSGIVAGCVLYYGLVKCSKF